MEALEVLVVAGAMLELLVLETHQALRQAKEAMAGGQATVEVVGVAVAVVLVLLVQRGPTLLVVLAEREQLRH
jgi:hypothetical protein